MSKLITFIQTEAEILILNATKNMKLIYTLYVFIIYIYDLYLSNMVYMSYKHIQT